MDLDKPLRRDLWFRAAGLGDKQEEDLLIIIAAVLGANSLCDAFQTNFKTHAGYPIGQPSYELAVLSLAFTVSHLAGNDVVQDGDRIAQVDRDDPTGCKRLSEQLTSLWYFGELFLFVLIGSSLDFSAISSGGGKAMVVLLVGTSFRALGIVVAFFWTDVPWKGRLFAYIATLPKATVQASIGGIALATGVPEGGFIQTAAVLAVALFAPIGVILIQLTVDALVGKEGSQGERSLFSEIADEAFDVVDQVERTVANVRRTMSFRSSNASASSSFHAGNQSLEASGSFSGGVSRVASARTAELRAALLDARNTKSDEQL